MNEINIYTLTARSAVFQNIENLLRAEKYINLSDHSNSLEYSFNKSRGKNDSIEKSDILFIDDFSFDKSNIINFLRTTIPSITKNNFKSVIYTDSLDSDYVNNISLSRVNGILHERETFLTSTYKNHFPTHNGDRKQYKNVPDKASSEKFIRTLQLITEGCICYDSIINTMLLKRYAWARGSDDFVSKNKTFEEKQFEEAGYLIDSLTPKEKEILLLISQGKQNKEIANELNTAVGTVEQHKAHIIKKLQLKSSTELIIFTVNNESIL